MGNANFCCQGRDDKDQVIRNNNYFKGSAISYENGEKKSYYSQKSYLIQKPQLTLGEQLIDDLMDVLSQNLIEQDWIQINDNDKLKLYCYEWKKSETAIINIIYCEFRLKCSLDKYINLNIEQMKQINKKIDEFSVLEDNQEFNESIRYISYKGMLLMSGKDFIYLKKSHQANNKYYEACRSIEDDKYYIEKKKTRCIINLSGQCITKEEEGFIRIQQYIDADLRMNVPLKTLKKQIQKDYGQYYDNLCKFIQ